MLTHFFFLNHSDFFLVSTILLVGPFGVVFLFSLFRPKLFCRCSSDPAGVKMKPAIYYFFEDIGSVDFKLGRTFRKEINARSVSFRFHCRFYDK